METCDILIRHYVEICIFIFPSIDKLTFCQVIYASHDIQHCTQISLCFYHHVSSSWPWTCFLAIGAVFNHISFRKHQRQSLLCLSITLWRSRDQKQYVSFTFIYWGLDSYTQLFVPGFWRMGQVWRKSCAHHPKSTPLHFRSSFSRTCSTSAEPSPQSLCFREAAPANVHRIGLDHYLIIWKIDKLLSRTATTRANGESVTVKF